MTVPKLWRSLSGRSLAALALCALALGVGVSAASAAAPQPCGGVPQITDVSGDGHHPSSDVLAAWFSEEAGRLQAVIKVRSSTWEPEHEEAEENGSGFAMIFGIAGQLHYVRARAWPHGEKPVSFDYGTFANGSWFTSVGPTAGEVVHAAVGGTATIDVPEATGAVPGATLSGPFVLTYDGITAGLPDWVDRAPGGTGPSDGARGADYVVGACNASSARTVAVQLIAPANLRGSGKARITGRVVPARGGVAIDLSRRGKVGRNRVLHLTSAADGRFAASVRVREVTRLSAVAEGISSQTLTIDVRSRTKVRARALPSGATLISGRIDPALPGRLLLLAANEVRPSAVCAAHGKRFRFRLRPGTLAPSSYQVVYIPRKGRAERSTSNTVRVR
jgi:hypothetical protein